MRPETLAALSDALLAADRVRLALDGVGADRFLEDWEKQAVVERQLTILGEALVRIRAKEPVVLGGIPEHEKAIGLRNLLVHGYDAVDAGTLYRLAQESLPALATAIRRVLPEIG
jgi:uncharacterized protein with HEPN domain